MECHNNVRCTDNSNPLLLSLKQLYSLYLRFFANLVSRLRSLSCVWARTLVSVAVSLMITIVVLEGMVNPGLCLNEQAHWIFSGAPELYRPSMHHAAPITNA